MQTTGVDWVSPWVMGAEEGLSKLPIGCAGRPVLVQMGLVSCIEKNVGTHSAQVVPCFQGRQVWPSLFNQLSAGDRSVIT